MLAGCDSVAAHMTDNKLSVKDMFLRGIAILGLIAVLLLGAWGIIQIALHLPGFFGRVGSSITSVFNREPSPVATTTPTTPATQTPTTPAKPATAVQNKSGKTSSTYVASGKRTNLYGLPDLTIHLVSSYSAWGRTTVQFQVSNLGTNVAGQGWSFNATLPIQNSYTVNSGPEPVLYPGDRIVYTLTFDSGDYGYDRDYRNRFVNILVDCFGVIYELNERNNALSIRI